MFVGEASNAVDLGRINNFKWDLRAGRPRPYLDT
jgi:hypothetical protein